MEYNIINKYIEFIEDKLTEFIKMIIGKDYPKKATKEFIDKYIEVRYFNETKYPTSKDFLNRLNKELLDVYKDYRENDKKTDDELLKTTFALFAYIVNIDDVYESEDDSVLDLLVNDENSKVSLTKENVKKLKNWLSDFAKSKEEFLDSIASNEFILTQNSVCRKTYLLTLDTNIKISNLYSEYAINKAYNSPVINEDKVFILLIQTCYELLKDAISLDFTKKYIVDIPPTILTKEKKFKRLLNTIDNTLARKAITLRIDYSIYKKYKDLFDEIIKDGYNVAVVIDEGFNGKITTLAIFSYIFVYEDSEFFDMIKNDEDKIESKVITI